MRPCATAGVRGPLLKSQTPHMGNTPMRTFRAADELWQRVVSAAAKRGVSTSDYIRDALEAYLKKRG